MRERTVQFGKTATMVGVLCEPADRAASQGRPVVIMLNSGILHRVGSCRFHVRVARGLAQAGFASLRFDFSGIGDSRPRRDSLPFEESSVVEIREAMDYLASRKGTEQFVLGGLCSGADAAYFCALVDPRVVGTFQLDAFAYRNLRYYWKHYAPRAVRFDVWQRFFGRLIGRSSDGPGSSKAAPGDELEGNVEMPEYVRVFPPKDEVEANLRKLAERKVRQYYFFSGSMSDCYNYENQFRDLYRSIDFGDTLRIEFVPESDHIVTHPLHQRFVVETIADWVGHWADSRADTGDVRTEAPVVGVAGVGGSG